MLTRRTKQINLYLRSHKEYIKQYTESTIRHLLPAGTESRIKEFFPYEFRDLTFDIDKDGYIIAAKTLHQKPCSIHTFRKRTRLWRHIESLNWQATSCPAASNDREWLPIALTVL